MDLVSPIIIVSLRICFCDLPDVMEERIFRDTMTILDLENHSLDDLESIIEKKIRFMEYRQYDFTMFCKDETGDRVVVDHSYYHSLMKKWSKIPSQQDDSFAESQLSIAESRFTSKISVSLSIEVELKKTHFDDQIPPVNSSKPIAPLTVENIAKVKAVSIGLSSADAGVCEGMSSNPKCCLVPINSLTCPPISSFYIRGVVVGIRFKTPKAGVEVVELDICDVSDSSIQISAISFDAIVRKAIKENLRADRRHVVELHNIYVRRKNDADIRYQSNVHPLLLRLDRHSKIEVVQILPVPLPQPIKESVVTVRPNMSSGGLLEVGALVGSNAMSNIKTSSYLSSASENSQLIHSQSDFRRNKFSQDSTYNFPLKSNVTSKLEVSNKKDSIPSQESLMMHITKKDVRAREETVTNYASKEEQRKERIRQRTEVSSQCILCGINLNDPANTEKLIRKLLSANRKNGGTHIPSLEELKLKLADNRVRPHDKHRIPRLLTLASFVNIETKTVHRVHCRCAHICTSYQQGNNIEDIVSCELAFNTCTLCDMPGATVRCYHPDCSEQYHSICALFSLGYVNFGKKDPYMPCPACPRHTQVELGKCSNSVAVLHEDSSCWDDEVVFDSRVVEATDLRDPDENGGL